MDGKRVVGTARLWDIVSGTGKPALLLGPVAVASDYRNRGIGAALVRRALSVARRQGHSAVILIGDAPYYGRFGFRHDPRIVLDGAPAGHFQALALAGAVPAGRSAFHPAFTEAGGRR